MANIVGTNAADLLIGTAEPDTIEGLGGDDELAGGVGNDTLDGGNGFDWIQLWRDNPTRGAAIYFGEGRLSGDPVNTGEDSFKNIEQVIGTTYGDYYDASTFGLVGSNGNFGSSGLFNIFSPLQGSDAIRGNGNTALFFNQTNETSGVTVDLSKGWARSLFQGNKVIYGGVNTVRGTSFADNITLGDPEGDGFGEYVRASLGNDTIDGGTGNDRVEYNRYNVSQSGIRVDMGEGTVSGKSDGSTDVLRNVERVIGTSFSDTFDARSFSLSSANAAGADKFLRLSNQFDGSAGNDTIYGNGQSVVRFNTAQGGVYVDLVSGSASGLDSNAIASVGVDSFTGVNGTYGSTYSDMLIGGNTNNARFEQFRGNAGSDTIDGGSGWDMSRYDDGPGWIQRGNTILFEVDASGKKLFTDSITVNLAAGLVMGGTAFGTDQIKGIEAILGSLNNDTFNATGFNGSSANAGSFGAINEFEGLYGNDSVTGNGSTRVSFKNAMDGVTVDLSKGQSYSSQYLIDKSDPAVVGVDTFSGVNAVAGSYHSDVFIGTSAKQYFYGADGDDTIKGGAGLDVAIYEGKRNEYIIAKGYDTAGKSMHFVFDTQAGRDGIDQIYDITRLQFSDTALALDIGVDDTAAEVFRIYKAAFNRTPDSVGLGYWIAEMDKGSTLTSIAASFVDSDEFKRLNGENVSNADFINAMYKNVLGRGADAGGLAYWLGDVANGTSKASVLASFSESAENIANVASIIAPGIQYTPTEAYPTQGLFI